MAHISEIAEAVSPETAIELIKKNSTTNFVWYVIKGKNGCIYQMCGNNFRNDLKMRIEIPFFEKGLPVTHENGFLKHNFSIAYNTNIHPNDGFSVNLEKFIEYAKKDLRKLEKTYEEVKVLTYETIAKYKFIK